MPHLRAFRFGVVAAFARTGEEWIARARRVESLGYATLVMPDNLQYTLAPLPALAMAAAATTSLRLGTYVLPNDFRNPVLLAKDAATLDLLSGGRRPFRRYRAEPQPHGRRRPGAALYRRLAPRDCAGACRQRFHRRGERFDPAHVRPADRTPRAAGPIVHPGLRRADGGLRPSGRTARRSVNAVAKTWASRTATDTPTGFA
jgi:Luciferase-like monooxygenase